MRPLELRLSNFRSYRQEARFDFRNRRLVGIVGPIGSGKSTILDAVTFALFGRTPRVGSATKSLIHQRADGATVSLRFGVDDEVWEVVRALRRKGQSQHALYRLDADEEGAEPVEKILLEGEVNGRIERLLGLEYDAFSKSVMLAQGRFAEFLEARPGERDKVLKGVFGHDRIDAMRTVAKTRATAAQVEADKVAIRLEAIERLQEQLAVDRETLSSLQKQLKDLADAEPEIKAIETELSAAAEALDGAERRLGELEGIRSDLPDTEQTADVLSAAASAAQVVHAAREHLAATRAASDAAAALVAAADAAGEPSLLEECGRLIAQAVPLRRALEQNRDFLRRAIERTDAAASAAAQAQKRLETAGVAAAAAREAAAHAGATEANAERDLHAARHADMAASLRGDLSVGDRCPVCTQVVGVIPNVAAASGVAGAEEQLEASRRVKKEADEAMRDTGAELKAAGEALEAATTEAASAAAAVAEAEQGVGAADVALASTTERLSELLGSGEATVLLAARRNAYERLVSDAAGRDREANAAQEAVDAAVTTAASAERDVDGLRVALAGIAARLGEHAIDLPADASSLATAAGDLRSRWETDFAGEQARRSAADAQRAAAGGRRRELYARLGIDTDYRTARTEVKTRAQVLGDQIARAERDVAAAAALSREQEEHERRSATHARLAADLTDAKFTRFLLDEERFQLAGLGSDHFQRLSSGRYRFTEDGTFDVVDLTAADAVRRADSLSGGETFLASLALALSLAEMVARIGGRLDAFFLDEGFGTLDPEHLDLAMEGIEALVAADEKRLVAVVSHVPELRQRIDDRIELDRDDATGDTRVRRT